MDKILASKYISNIIRENRALAENVRNNKFSYCKREVNTLMDKSGNTRNVSSVLL